MARDPRQAAGRVPVEVEPVEVPVEWEATVPVQVREDTVSAPNAVPD